MHNFSAAQTGKFLLGVSIAVLISKVKIQFSKTANFGAIRRNFAFSLTGVRVSQLKKQYKGGKANI